MKIVKNITSAYNKVGQKLNVISSAPTEKQAKFMLFVFGVTLLSLGVQDRAMAAHAIAYNDERLAGAVNAILTYIEGSFGAMVMVAAGIGAILSSAMGQYRAALGLLVVAVGAFILRSFVGTFFNDVNLQA